MTCAFSTNQNQWGKVLADGDPREIDHVRPRTFEQWAHTGIYSSFIAAATTA